jgi:hypothetical protein
MRLVDSFEAIARIAFLLFVVTSIADKQAIKSTNLFYQGRIANDHDFN